MAMPRVLILEDSQTIGALFRDQLEGEPVEIVIAETAAEARERFEHEEFDILVLDGIAPSEPGRGASLVGPILAREFRERGFMGSIIAISSEPEAQALTKKAANEAVSYRAYACDKLDLGRLVKELLGLLWPTTPA